MHRLIGKNGRDTRNAVLTKLIQQQGCGEDTEEQTQKKKTQ